MVILKSDLKKISKELSYVLRHKPEAIGITLDPNGWVNVNVLIDAFFDNSTYLTRELLDEVVFSNDKQRFGYSDDGKSIRANQGHSVDIDIDLLPMCPPDMLYHGTTTKFIEPIKRLGLIRKQRNHVHLSESYSTAESVGQRHGKPVVLSINAKQMEEDGEVFFLSKNGVWLTRYVGTEYIIF